MTSLCEEDHECDPNFYCYEVSHMCAQCTDCEAYNRERSLNILCAKSPSDCGACLAGFESKKLTDGANQNFCTAMNYLQDPEKLQLYSTIWVYGVLISVLLIFILLCLVVNKIMKNRRYQETEIHHGDRIIQSSLSQHVTEEIQHNINIVEIDHDYLQQDAPYRFNESLVVSLHFDDGDQEANDDPSTDSDFHDADTVSPVESLQSASDCDDGEYCDGSISIDSINYEFTMNPAVSIQLTSDADGGECNGENLNAREDISSHSCIKSESRSCSPYTGTDNPDTSMNSCQETDILEQNISLHCLSSASTIRSFIINDSSSESSGPDDSGISGDSSHNISILCSPEDYRVRHFKLFARSCDSDETEPEAKRRKNDSGSCSVASSIFEELDSSNTED